MSLSEAASEVSSAIVSRNFDLLTPSSPQLEMCIEY